MLQLRRVKGRNLWIQDGPASLVQEAAEDTKENRGNTYRYIYSDKYPNFWHEFRDILDPAYARGIDSLHQIKAVEKPQEQNTPFEIPQQDTYDPDETNVGFSIEPAAYTCKDLQRGFNLEEPVEFEEFVEHCNQIKEINARTISTDDPRDGFNIPLPVNAANTENTEINHPQQEHPAPRENSRPQSRRGGGRGGGSTNSGRGRGYGRGAGSTNSRGRGRGRGRM